VNYYGGPPVVLYRIEGGGHGWPGGPQYAPARVIGPVPRDLDATAILLDMVRGVSNGAGTPSGLEKRLTATTEAPMTAAGEPTGAGRA
jgi:poly(3-hydroxybutyrate) depolymerase